MRTLRYVSMLALVASLCAPSMILAHDPDYTDTFDRAGCTFATTGESPYFPLWPGYAVNLEGEELDDDDELVEIAATITILRETEMVDGVLTRVVEERETEDGELVEISRNFMAVCRETGDLWYFGEDVDDYDDGMIVGHDGAWRAGVDGARPGVLIPGSPLIGARYFQEVAPGVALDRAEVSALDAMLTVPAGTFDNLLYIEEDSAIEPDADSEKWYAQGIGLVKDDELELVSVDAPPCLPDGETHCLNHGRFEVEVEWEDFQGNEGDGTAILASGLSGEFWFFNPENTELIVKVLDACNHSSNSFWVFAAGLTNVEVTITVTDTQTGQMRAYENELGTDFAPVLDTAAFQTCP